MSRKDLVSWTLPPSSFVGDGSQAVVTLSFALSDALRLQAVSCVGASLQLAFFLSRPPPRIVSSICWSGLQASGAH